MVKEWFVFAGRDIRAAKAVFDLGPDYKNIAAFNCQQCVEKAIKGYLVFHNIRPPKIHDIKDLAKLVFEIDKNLAEKLMKAEMLTQYAVTYRYPDAEKKPLTLKQAESALKLAQKILDLLLDNTVNPR